MWWLDTKVATWTSKTVHEAKSHRRTDPCATSEESSRLLAHLLWNPDALRRTAVAVVLLEQVIRGLSAAVNAARSWPTLAPGTGRRQELEACGVCHRRWPPRRAFRSRSRAATFGIPVLATSQMCLKHLSFTLGQLRPHSDSHDSPTAVRVVPGARGAPRQVPRDR